MSAELKPCPFCGSADIRFMGSFDDRGGVAVYCAAAGCDCAMGANWDRDALPDHAYRDEEEATTAWNRRATQTDTPEAGQEAAAVQAVGAWPAELPLRLQVSYSPGDWDTFVYGVSGHLSMEVLTNIEAEIRGEDAEALFEHGPGDYLLSASYFRGQYGPEGQREIAPGWELEIEGFRPPAVDPAGEKP